MNQTKDLLKALKRCIRAKGLTYRDVAVALDLSEASVKRIFSEGTFTVARLEQVCRFLDMSIYDLARLTRLDSEDEVAQLSVEQEQGLADDPLALTYFYLLLTGRTPEKIAKEFGLDDRQQTTMLVRLSRLKLVELYPNNSGRLLTSRRIAWRREGPIRRLYERQVTSAFMNSGFERRDESLLFDTGELSEASVKVLFRKFEKMTQDFDELADLDISLPAPRKKAYAMMIAFRPWTYWAILEQTANDMGLNAARSQAPALRKREQ
jgi:transcriptional regulator with XRE-family HTH domain